MLKKLLTYSVVITTIVWSVGLLAMPLTVGAAAVSGDLVKKAGSPAVYYFGADSKLHVFASAAVYSTWYSNFDGVKTLSATEFDAYNFGEIVFPKAGVKLVQAVDGETPWHVVNGRVYALSGDGVLRQLMSADVAAALYGSNWESKIIPIPAAIFSQFKSTGAEVSSASSYNVATETATYSTINEAKNLAGGGAVSTGTSLTVALAADTPAAGIVTSNAARYGFTKVNLTASADGDIIVDSLTIRRAGLAHDAVFSSVDVLDAATGLAINAYSKTFGSTHEAVVNDDITVPAGTTKSIILAGNMGSLAIYAGETPILQLSSITLKGTATTIGTLPISGNYQTTNGTITIGTVDVTDGGDNPSASTQNVGTTDYILSSVKLAANSVEPITIEKVSFTQNGSASLADVQNVRLIKANTGEVLATIAKPDNKKITFNLSMLLDKGKNVTLDIKGDIVGGSGRDISFDIDQTTDIVVKGTTYGYYITPTFATTGAGSTPQYNAANTAVGNGTLNIESATVTPTNVASNKTQVTVGKLKFTAKGEKLNITSIGWVLKVATTTASTQANREAVVGDVTNVTVYDESGSVVAGPLDPTINTTDVTAAGNVQMTATTTDTITVPIGGVTYTVKADLSSDFSTNDTVAVAMNPGSITCKGETTGNSVTPTPAGTITSTTLTVKTGSLTASVGTTPAAQNVVVGTQNYTFATLNLSAADSATDVVITQLKLVVHSGGNAYPDLVSGIKLYDGTTEIVPNNYPGSVSYSSTGTTAASNATTTYLFNSGVFKIPAGTSKTITVKANVGSGPSISGSDTLAIGVTGAAISSQDGEGNTISPTITNGDGSAMTLASAGTIYLTGKTTPASALVVAGTTVPVGKFILKAVNENLTVDKIALKINAAGSGIAGDYDDILSLTLYKDGDSTPVGSVTVDGANATITPSTALVLTKDTDTNFTVNASFATLSAASAAVSGEGIYVTVPNFEATSAQSGGTVTRTGIPATFNNFNLFKSVPTVSTVTNSAKITGYSQTELAKFKISADALGPVSIYKLSFGVTTTTVGIDTATFNLYQSDSASTLGTKLSDQTDDITATYMEGAGVLVTAFMDAANSVSGSALTQFIIDAGTTKYFTFVGTPTVTGSTGHDSTGGNESISVSLLGDPTWAGTTQLNAGDVAASGQGDFVWSDLNNDTYASTSATATAMFYNGYRVSGMNDTTNTAMVITD
ncbi:MAG: hypothetical protein WCW26_00590 [Candidatus Buchananbacteria bacterium]